MKQNSVVHLNFGSAERKRQNFYLLVATKEFLSMLHYSFIECREFKPNKSELFEDDSKANTE